MSFRELKIGDRITRMIKYGKLGYLVAGQQEVPMWLVVVRVDEDVLHANADPEMVTVIEKESPLGPMPVVPDEKCWVFDRDTGKAVDPGWFDSYLLQPNERKE